jgi:HEAT repeat protein
MRVPLLAVLTACLLLPASLRADDEGAAAALATQLRDNDIGKRNAAAERLVNLGPAAVPVLRKALEDKVSRLHAADALSRIGRAAKDAVPELAAVLKLGDEPETSSAAATALARIGAPAVPALREALKEKDNRLQAHAATALKRIGPDAKDAVPELVAVVKFYQGKEAAELARLEAIDALGRIGPKARDAVPALTDTLKEKTPHSPARLRAAIALGEIGAPAKPAVTALVDALNDDGAKAGPLRFHAATALGKIGPDAGAAVLPLVDLLNDKKAGPVRLLAAEALGNIGPAARDAVGSLKEAAGADDKAVAAAAAKALDKIQK